MKKILILVIFLLFISSVSAIGEDVVDCTPLETKCVGEVLMECKENGKGFRIVDVCDYGCAENVVGGSGTCVPPPLIVFSLLAVFAMAGIAFVVAVMFEGHPTILRFLRKKY